MQPGENPRLDAFVEEFRALCMRHHIVPLYGELRGDLDDEAIDRIIGDLVDTTVRGFPSLVRPRNMRRSFADQLLRRAELIERGRHAQASGDSSDIADALRELLDYLDPPVDPPFVVRRETECGDAPLAAIHDDDMRAAANPRCPRCGATLHMVSREPLPDGGFRQAWRCFVCSGG